jgi:hypothetical protein
MKLTGGEGGSHGRCAFAQRGLAASRVAARSLCVCSADSRGSVTRLPERPGTLRRRRWRVQRVCASAARVALTAVMVSGTVRAQAATTDGCQGPPTQETTITKATVVFIWPCFAHADTFLEPDPTEAQRILDDKMLTQYVRLRARFSSAEGEVIKASGAFNLRVIHSRTQVRVNPDDRSWLARRSRRVSQSARQASRSRTGTCTRCRYRRGPNGMQRTAGVGCAAQPNKGMKQTKPAQAMELRSLAQPPAATER